MTKVLLVDDEGEALLSLSRALKSIEPSLVIEGAGAAARALELVEKSDPHVAIIDLSLDQKSGVESGFTLLRSILGFGNRCKVIVLTGHSSVENGVRALNLGASHFIEKPPDVTHLVALIKDCARQSELFRALEVRSSGAHSLLISQELIGESREIVALREELLFAASTNQSILLVGETGTGKTLCASLIHQLSLRAPNRFVCYTPGYQNADLVNSDLYGHVKGSFTGALDSRVGLLRQADRGTLFLDEVDELPKDTQVSLLRAVQSREYRPLGSNIDERSDFRLITATNRPHEDLVKDGKLREDFYHRIAHKIIRVPALRERKSDIAQLAESFVASLNEREHVKVFSIEGATVKLLESHEWPGNVRELQAVIEGAAYLAQFRGRSTILEEDIRQGSRIPDSGERRGGQCGFHELVERFKEKLVIEAMEKSGGNQVQAARLLGLDRSSLRRILGKE